MIHEIFCPVSLYNTHEYYMKTVCIQIEMLQMWHVNGVNTV